MQVDVIGKHVYRQIEQGKMDEAIKYCKGMLEMHDLQESVFIYPLLAQAYLRKGDYENSSYYLHNGLALAKGQSDKHTEAYIYILESTWECELERGLDKAMALQKKALVIAEGLQDKGLMVKSYNNLGVLCREQGQYEEALVWMEKAVEHSKDLEDYMEKIAFVMIRANIGRIYSRQGHLEQAKQLFNEVIEKKNELCLPRYIAIIYVALAEVKKEEKAYEEAIGWLDKALEIYTEIGNKLEESEIYKVLSSIYEAKEDYKNALAFYKCYTELREVVKG